MTEREAYIAFAVVKGIGPRRFKLMCEYFGSAVAAWNASLEELKKIGLPVNIIEELKSFRQSFSLVAFLADCAKKEISITTLVDADYPAPLKEIPDPPIALFIKGTLPKTFGRCFGVVGTRKPTPYGQTITRKLVAELATSGVIIVSGLARGIDSIAHRTTLGNGGITIAVLGCGVDIVYPPEHKSLYAEIIAMGGAVVSEVPPGHFVAKGLFPARNRIISGLSRGVVVTEGAEDSGSLITASLALEQGRDVFAVPGPINSYLSAGPVKLLKHGAKLVTEARDILEELKLPIISAANGVARSVLSEEAKKILAIVEKGMVTFDEIVQESQLPSAQVSATLTMLELSGILKSLGEGKYTLL